MDTFANLIIRPPRAHYETNDLGPKYFTVENEKKRRIDFEVKNDFGLTIKCTLYIPYNLKDIQYPCVLYCHGNSSSRLEATDLVELLLPDDIALACFDFSGSGLSEGKYVTLGYNEKDDIKCVMKALRDMSFISDIAIWGRSMGAASTILYAATDPKLVGLVLDSPFASLNQLCFENIQKFSILTTIFASVLVDSIRNTIMKKANFDIEKINPIDEISQINIPIFFLHGKKDRIIPISHSKKLYEASKSGIEFMQLELDHNDPRSYFTKLKIKIFLRERFMIGRKKRQMQISSLNQIKESLNPRNNYYIPSNPLYNESRDIRKSQHSKTFNFLPRNDIINESRTEIHNETSENLRQTIEKSNEPYKSDREIMRPFPLKNLENANIEYFGQKSYSPQINIDIDDDQKSIKHMKTYSISINSSTKIEKTLDFDLTDRIFPQTESNKSIMTTSQDFFYNFPNIKSSSNHHQNDSID